MGYANMNNVPDINQKLMQENSLQTDLQCPDRQTDRRK